jgi:hypothetical protein
VPKGSQLGKPRNESIIAALTGQQTPENDKEDRPPGQALSRAKHVFLQMESFTKGFILHIWKPEVSTTYIDI